MAEDEPGRVVGSSYRLIRPIGQGATGTVWRGEDNSSGEPVAIKLLHESLLRQPRLVTRFVQERTILLMLRHPNVVRVRDLFSADESLGLVMDLVDGGNLRDHLHRERTLPPGEAARIGAQKPEAKPRGPWQCSQGFVLDLSNRTPLGPRPCHSVGKDVRYQGQLTAPAGGRARIEVTLRDAGTGRTVAGPTTCTDLSFTRQTSIRGCGPAGATPRRGRSYTVVMSYQYVRDGRTTRNTTKGDPFTW